MGEGGQKDIPQLQKDNFFFKFLKNNTWIKPLMTVKQEFFIFYFIGVKQEVCFLWLKKDRYWVDLV